MNGENKTHKQQQQQERKETQTAANTSRAHARWGPRTGAARARYLRCWRRCCVCFVGYQHGLVSTLCAWLRPRAERGEGGEREKTKRKRKKKQ